MKLYGSFFCLFSFSFLFLVVGRSADNFFFFFCDCTHSCSIKNFKKIVKKRKKRENISKKDKQLHLVFNVWLSASIFHVFGVFLICRSVQTGCVLDFLQEADNPAWSRPLPVPICSYSMKSCT